MDNVERAVELKRLLRDKRRILVLDGAMGTSIQERNLSAEDFGGPNYDGCNEYLSLTRPDLIKEIHKGFVDAGADILETNTFGATRIVLDEYGLAEESLRINRTAAGLAREIAADHSVEGKMIFVAGSMGPTTKTISVTGGIGFDELAYAYWEQAVGLIQGGVDLLLLETSQDTINVKAGLDGIDKARQECGIDVPVAVQGTIEPMGTLLAGQDAEAFYTSLEHRDLLWIGFNCATGPEFMTDHVRTLAGISRFPVACVPNAGLPDEDGRYNETPESMAATLDRFVDAEWVNVIGGCCGTGPSHIKKLVDLVRGRQSRVTQTRGETRVSGIETVVADETNKPLIIGERANVLGSRKFKQLIEQGLFEEASEIARRQVRSGAHILDVCLQDPDREEVFDMNAFLDILTRKVKVPIMVDSTDSVVIEAALKRLQGKSIINSINLEDGEERFMTVVPLAKRYGAALVVGCIDDDREQAQAITRQRKLEVAKRSYGLLTEKYGIPKEDIIFDPLVFPAGTGDSNYVGSAAETIEGIRLIKKAFPHSKTVLGISNVSFGLPAAGREVFNSVFLYHCVQAGLDMAIVNSQMIRRFASIEPKERELSENLIWNFGDDPVAEFADYFRGKKPERIIQDRTSIPLDERLSLAIIEGTKHGLIEDLNEALTGRSALGIINGPLMDGMDEVGRLFNTNQLIVAEVLQSAEAMKFAVSHLEPFMERSDVSTKGRILLATVKGDVHDIGKNLVDIILSNNGYDVINLGIKVPPHEIIEACNTYHPDLIGLSGLLVKSAQMMVESVTDLKRAGIGCPIIVGGAALSNRFTRLRIGPEYGGIVAYAQDAMDGLSLTKGLMDKSARATLELSLASETDKLLRDQALPPKVPSDTPRPWRKTQLVNPAVAVPNPPDLLVHVVREYPLDEIFPYINPQMLYVRHLGFKGRFNDELQAKNPDAEKLRERVIIVEEKILGQSNINANAVFKFLPCNSEGDEIIIKTPRGDQIVERFLFGRQSEREGLSLSDYIAPDGVDTIDYIAMFVTTIGPGVRDLANQWNAEGNYLDSHILQALALEGAEAFAELMHQQIRKMWGFPDSESVTYEDLFHTKYRGRRYSFGYPACPRLEDQAKLFALLDVENNIQVNLTDGFMMDPEGSVSAIVVHHPDAKYFTLDEIDTQNLEARVANQL